MRTHTVPSTSPWDRARSRDELEPHVFATSSRAFQTIIDGGPEQTILVSGESGAGKTETVKIMLGHICPSRRPGGSEFLPRSLPPSHVPTPTGLPAAPHIAFMAASDDTSVVEKTVELNPLLESFGNAQVRNDSR